MRFSRSHDSVGNSVEIGVRAVSPIIGDFRPGNQWRTNRVGEYYDDDGTWPDRDCILEPGDWSELEHRSTVAYSTAKFGAVAERLEAAISKGDFRVITSPPYDTLRRIVMAGRGSRGIPQAAARLLAKL